ncbi:hypothetical protein [Schleiferilactobacillus harbinensis]|uniref:Uncharacterized protein n=1 Tax=Schleiferilactobacillus harbinensis TaxID=304207 RepID=A0A5P8M4U4_9LACO|nr:hypothetical protein [Schleiferilactobacillus harbinensis]QFR23121.1 hypothetical protein D1010_06720 [Schleiferilactobacillus harbinensis]
MDLTGIAKLYAPDGREYKRLYDNQGRLIWQSGPPVLWQGDLTWTTTTPTQQFVADPTVYQGLLFEFNQPLQNAKYAYVAQAVSGNRVTVPLSTIAHGDENYLELRTDTNALVAFEVKIAASNLVILNFARSSNFTSQGVTLKAIYGIEK